MQKNSSPDPPQKLLFVGLLSVAILPKPGGAAGLPSLRAERSPARQRPFSNDRPQLPMNCHPFHSNGRRLESFFLPCVTLPLSGWASRGSGRRLDKEVHPDSEIKDFGQLHSEFSPQIEADELHDGRFERLTNEGHAGLSGSSPPFVHVAPSATGHNVRPLVGSPLHFWYDMIYGQLA